MDTTSPYSTNANTSITSPLFTISGGGASLGFDVQCDTEYTHTSWNDYLEIQYSTDGTHFVPVQDPLFGASAWRIDEAYLDDLTGNTSQIGSASYTFSEVSIPTEYTGESFSIRFLWKTNDLDNNYAGCSIDNIQLIRFSDGSDETYASLSGTSMATPHVAGLAALLWSFKPSLSLAEVKNTLLNTGDALGSLTAKTVTGKRINAYNALQSVNPAKAITGFDFTDPAVTGAINETDHTIQLSVPATPVLTFTPTITITGASVSPASGVAQDFTNPVTYTVTAADGSTQIYIATVSQILDKTLLTQRLTTDIGADHATPVYALTSTDYTSESWQAYTDAVVAAIAVEQDI